MSRKKVSSEGNHQVSLVQLLINLISWRTGRILSLRWGILPGGISAFGLVVGFIIYLIFFENSAKQYSSPGLFRLIMISVLMGICSAINDFILNIIFNNSKRLKK